MKDQTIEAMDESRLRQAVRAKVDISVNMTSEYSALSTSISCCFFSSMMSF